MFSSKLLYYIANFGLQNSFDKEIGKLVKNKKKIVVFDVGCYRGTFTRKILNSIKKKKYQFYLFDINKKVKEYISNLTKLKNIFYQEIALTNKKGLTNYNYNSFFESAGSSLSNLVKDDHKWNYSRKLILKFLFLNTKGFTKYKVRTTTLDSFVKINKIKSIDVLKIDIEGSEYNLLLGAKNILKKNRINIILVEIIEKKEKYHAKEKKILNMLEKMNFVLIKKANILSISMLSNIKGADYLLVNNRYLKS